MGSKPSVPQGIAECRRIAAEKTALLRAIAAEQPTLPAVEPCEDCGAKMVQTSHDTWECGADCPGSNDLPTR